MNGGITFRGNSESIRSKISTRTGHILAIFRFFLNYYKLTEIKKFKCKIKINNIEVRRSKDDQRTFKRNSLSQLLIPSKNINNMW